MGRERGEGGGGGKEREREKEIASKIISVPAGGWLYFECLLIEKICYDRMSAKIVILYSQCVLLNVVASLYLWDIVICVGETFILPTVNAY